MFTRKLEAGDLSPLQKILKDCGVFTLAEVDCAIELLEIVLKDEKQTDYEVMVALVDNQVAGYSMYGPIPLCEGNFDLYWIATAPQFQGQGIGRQLLQQTEQLLKRNGARMLCLETSSQDIYARTRKFYLDAGYTEEARICDFYRLGDDRITYVKRFTHLH